MDQRIIGNRSAVVAEVIGHALGAPARDIETWSGILLIEYGYPVLAARNVDPPGPGRILYRKGVFIAEGPAERDRVLAQQNATLRRHQQRADAIAHLRVHGGRVAWPDGAYLGAMESPKVPPRSPRGLLFNVSRQSWQDS